MSGPPSIDREKTTPFLLKLFYRNGSFHRPEEFNPSSPQLPPHLQIYTWQTCTFRELTHLLTSALPTILSSPAVGTRIAYRLVYPDARPSRDTSSTGLPPARFLTKELGSVVVGEEESKNDGDEKTNGVNGAAANLDGDADKTLQEVRFVIGDYVSCAVFPPLPNGSVAPPPGPAGPSRLVGGGPRGGYGGGPLRDGGRGRGFRDRDRDEFGRNAPTVPPGEWRRGERLPDGGYGGGSGRGRGRGKGW